VTLVVGLRSAQGLHLLSDTRISHRDVTQVEELPGRLKIVLLGPNICVAYAGTADNSLDIIRAAPAPRSIEETLQYFHAAHIAAAKHVDFVVGCAADRSLFNIRDGIVEPVESECWIGDGTAFEEYRRRKRAVHVPPGTPEQFEKILRAQQAFGGVIQDRVVSTVGGLTVGASSRSEGFGYISQALAYYPSQTIPSGIATPLTFGGAAEGGFAYTLLVPLLAGASVIAAHFLQGSLGFVYAPLHADKPISNSERVARWLEGNSSEDVWYRDRWGQIGVTTQV
jgi:hypothetical protein